MNGLENMLDEILNKSRDKAQNILEKADGEAQTIKESARKRTDEEAQKIKERADQKIRNIEERRDAALALRKKQAALLGKQEIMQETVQKVREYFKNLPEGPYEECMLLVYKKHIPAKDAVIRFNANDLNALTEGTKKEMTKLAQNQGAKVTFGESRTAIENGFIIDYDGIEENCSFDALVDERMTEIQDLIRERLFKES